MKLTDEDLLEIMEKYILIICRQRNLSPQHAKLILQQALDAAFYYTIKDYKWRKNDN